MSVSRFTRNLQRQLEETGKARISTDKAGRQRSRTRLSQAALHAGLAIRTWTEQTEDEDRWIVHAEVML